MEVDVQVPPEDVAAVQPPTRTLGSMRLSAAALRQWGLASVTPLPGAVPDERANGLAFSDSGRLLVSSHNDGTLRIINGVTGDPDGVYRVKDYGCKLVTATHHESCFLHAANTKPVDERCGVVAYHSLHDNSVIRYFKAHTQSITSISMSPRDDSFITASRDGTYKLWDLRAPHCQASGSLDSTGGFADGPIAAFDNSGRVFAVVTPMRTLALFDAGNPSAEPFELTRNPLLEFTVNPAPYAGSSGPLPPRLPQRVVWTGLEFSPDDRFIALNTADRGVLLVDSFFPTRELALLQSHAYDPAQASNIAFSLDGRILAVGSADGHVFAYDVSEDPPHIETGNSCPDKKLPPLCYLPGRWQPAAHIVGVAHKSPAAAETAYAGAAGHRERLDAALLEYTASQARRTNVHTSVIAPPPVIPSVPLPYAASAEEQMSRLEGPVRFVRWHPRQAVLASAASSVGVWMSSPTAPDGGDSLAGSATVAE